MTDPLRYIRVCFADDDLEDLLIPLEAQSDPRSLSSDVDVPITLPSGEKIAVYAEVGLEVEIADVSLSVVEDNRVTAVRCGRGVVLSYTTIKGTEVLLQVGTGAWES